MGLLFAPVPLVVGSPAAPVISSFSPNSGPIGTKVTIQGDSFTGTTTVSFGGVSASFTIFSAQQIIATVPQGANSGLITVVTGGGSASSSSNFILTQANPPTITSFDPSTGAPGTDVTISGTSLSGATDVRFNGVAAAFHVSFDGNSLVATVPAGATTGPLTVVTPSGTATSGSSFSVSSVPAPQLSDFSPASATVGTQVVINGSNLAGATEVSFNGVDATFSLFGDTITAVVPAGATSGPIRVVTPGGSATSSSNFIVTKPGEPTVTDFSPKKGKPGASVTISGDNLQSISSVQFNGVSATFELLGTSLIATVPAGALSGLITVVTANGTASSASAFTVLNPNAPEITNFSPGSGADGTQVTIAGNYFSNVTQVSFAGVSASFTPVSPTQINAIVPAGATSGPISVTTPLGTDQSTNAFLLPAQITSLSPAFGPVGSAVSIKGVNFSGALAVLFNGENALFTLVSPGEILAVVPKTATSGYVSVATPVGFASSDTMFFLPPEIDQFDPPSAPVGESVTITGQNLVGATSVQFGGVAASFAVVSSTTVTAVVPGGGKNGPITVTSPGGAATSSGSFFIGLFSDLNVSLAAAPSSVGVGDFLQYTVTVTNRGPLDATNVVVTERLPAEVSVVLLPSKNCTQNNNVVTCNLGTVSRGTDVAFQITTSISGGAYLTNTAAVSFSGTDPVPDDNTASLVTILQGAPPPPQDQPVTLSSTISGGSLQLSWPVSTTAFVLESTASLIPPVTWSTVNSLAVTNAGTISVTQSTGSGDKFYRLRKP